MIYSWLRRYYIIDEKSIGIVEVILIPRHQLVITRTIIMTITMMMRIILTDDHELEHGIAPIVWGGKNPNETAGKMTIEV